MFSSFKLDWFLLISLIIVLASCINHFAPTLFSSYSVQECTHSNYRIIHDSYVYYTDKYLLEDGALHFTDCFTKKEKIVSTYLIEVL